MNKQQNLSPFLSTIGLAVDQEDHSYTRHQTDGTENFVSVLSYYGLLAVEGPDAAKFLQGQISCDVNSIDEQHCSQGSYCTPKGRMLSSFLLAQQDKQDYLLRMRRPLVETTQSALAKYIVFSKAKQHSAINDYQIIGLFGDKAKVNVRNMFGDIPNARYQRVNREGNLAIQMDDRGWMFECWIKSTDLPSLWPHLSADLALQGSKQWALLNIRLGLGEVCPETVDMFLPQMLNYHLTGAISFKKGCYTGQEIVARMQYRGKLKRGMYRLKTADNSLQPGTELYLSSNSDQSIGNIVNTVSSEGKINEALAVLTHSATEEGNIVVGVDKNRVEIQSLPYTVNNKVT